MVIVAVVSMQVKAWVWIGAIYLGAIKTVLACGLSKRSATLALMLSAFLTKFSVRAQKVAFYSHDRVDFEVATDTRARDIQVVPEPFPYIIVDDFFKPHIYHSLCIQFDEVKRRGLLEEPWSPDRFHRFNMDYDGYVYTPPPTLNRADPMSIFFSLEWNWFFSKIFRQFTGFETVVAFHHHPSGNRTGFVHHDNVDKRFSPLRRLANGVMYGEGAASDPVVAHRKIALLYFLGNDEWQEGDGGETGLYSADGKALVKKVAPINNRLLAFQISPISMHAFQENLKERNSIVQWFHVPPELA
ncbi:MAG: 2OG-Fe(II) oxygenase [bacterium]|nr:2OG-Fe(II) oxygenase [bacterium]